MALADSATLRHRIGTNGFFTALLRDQRTHPARQLSTWWSAWKCAEAWGRVVRPDGYGVWEEPAARVPFLLEYDHGPEADKRLAEKLPGYRDILTGATAPTRVLFCFESSRREAAARRLLVGAPKEFATAALERGRSPADAVWLPIAGSQRLRMAELFAVGS
jgi:hypothetical protein